MKTEDLIKLIAEDTRRPINLSAALLAATAGGAVITGVAFFSTIGLRPDIGQAIETVRFLFKFSLPCHCLPLPSHCLRLRSGRVMIRSIGAGFC